MLSFDYAQNSFLQLELVESWWERLDSNRWPLQCQCSALTNWATPPKTIIILMWYRREDSNLHARRHLVLNQACLPISPLRHKFASIFIPKILTNVNNKTAAYIYHSCFIIKFITIKYSTCPLQNQCPCLLYQKDWPISFYLYPSSWLAS